MKIPGIHLFIPLLLLLYQNAGAQSSINGKIEDSLNNPLPNASIVLRAAHSKAILAFAISDITGHYRITFADSLLKKELELEVSAIGFRIRGVPVASTDHFLDFILYRKPTDLSAVTVVGEKPMVTARGDTTSFEVGSFSNVHDNVIGDVLRKMPGFSVDANGQISYNGKAISGYYIDGDDLLGQKYSIANNTLTTDMVRQVQVIEHHQPIEALKNIDFTDAVILNLIIKDSARIKPVGRASVGAGLPGLYDAELAGLLFSKKLKFINYIKTNNIGKDLLEDITPHKFPESSEVGRQDPAGLPVELSNSYQPPLEKSRYLFNNSALLNTTALFKLSPRTQLKTNLSLYHDNARTSFSYKNIIFLPQDTITYQENYRDTAHPSKLDLGLEVTTNRPGFYLDNTVKISGSIDKAAGSVQTTDRFLNQALTNRLFNGSNQFSFIKVIGNNMVAHLSSYSYLNTSHQVYTNHPAVYSFLSSQEDSQTVTQQVRLPDLYTNDYFALRATYVRNVVNLKMGLNHLEQSLRSRLFANPPGEEGVPVDSFQNRTGWKKNSWYGSIGDYITTKDQKTGITLSLPVEFQQGHLTDSARSVTHEEWFIDPGIQIRFEANKYHSISARYNYNAGMGPITQLYPYNILTNYRTVQSNDLSWSTERINTWSLSYFYKNPLTITFANLSLLYTDTRLNYIDSTTISADQTKNVIVPEAGVHTSTYSLLSGWSKYLFSWRTTMTLNDVLQYLLNTQLENAHNLRSNTLSNTLGGSLHSKMTRRLTANYTFSLLYAMGETRDLEAHSISPNSIIQWHQSLDFGYEWNDRVGISCKSDHYYNSQSTTQYKNSFFQDASFFYKLPGTKTDFSFTVNNIFDVKEYNTSYVSGNAFTLNSYSVRPTNFLVNVSFNF